MTVYFQNLTIKLLNMDALLQCPLTPSPSHLTKVEMKILQGIRDAYKSGNLKEVRASKKNTKKLNHPRLWQICGEEELKRRNFSEAEFAFIHAKNWEGLQFLKTVQGLHHSFYSAEISAFLCNFEQAEAGYCSIGRGDLALNMWKLLDDPRKKRRLLRGPDGDATVDLCPKRGDELFRKGDFYNAAQTFRALQDHGRELECYLADDNFRGVMSLLPIAKEEESGSEFMGKFASTLEFFGITNEAVSEGCEWEIESIDSIELNF